jgi:hypothetical protein
MTLLAIVTQSLEGEGAFYGFVKLSLTISVGAHLCAKGSSVKRTPTPTGKKLKNYKGFFTDFLIIFLPVKNSAKSFNFNAFLVFIISLYDY